MVKDLLSFSDCGLYFAYSGPDGKLKLWDSVSGILKQEYVPNLHLKSPCTSLIWINTTSSVATPAKTKKRKVDESSSLTLALGTADGSIALYSFSEGKVLTILNDGDSYPITSLSWVKEVGLFASYHKNVALWDISKKKVKCKWKCGKDKINSLAVSEEGDLMVTGGHCLSLWRIAGEAVSLVRSYTGHSSEAVCLKFISPHYFLSASSEERHISVWTTKADSDEPLGRFALGEVLYSDVSILENNGLIYLCAPTKDGTLHYFKHQLNGKIGKVIKFHERLEIVSEDDSSQIIPIVCAKLSSDSSAHIAYGHPPFLSFEPIRFSESEKKRTTLSRSLKFSSKTGSAAGAGVNSKLITGSDSLAEYVGNGVRKKSSRTGGEEVSMENRLGNLSLSKPIVADKHSPHNLANLLIQGLESRDKSLLESVLFRTEPAVINETVSKLPVTALPPLIAHLSHMIQGKTFSSVRGCMWLKGVMRHHSGQLLASSETVSSLASLQCLVGSRLALLGPLRALYGRLDHIVSQLHSPSQQVQLTDQTVVVYHDEDSGEDGESQITDRELSESEDVWDEGTDDPLDTETS